MRPQFTRREFVKAAALLGAAPLTALAQPESASATMPMRELGRTGARVSRLGIGCAPFQRTTVSIDDITAMLHRAIELGINYIDTAPNYGNGQLGYAEEKMGPAIKELRDKFFLVTKTEEPGYDATWALLRESMRRMQTDRLDLVHLHNLGAADRFEDLDFVFSDQGAMGALREAKRLGVVRFIGASGHLHPARFDRAITSGEIDVLMNAVNFVVQHTYSFEEKVWSKAREANIGLVAMKVLGGQGRGGDYALPEEHYRDAMRYALSLPGCHCAVIGLKSIAELELAAATVSQAEPLTADEAQRLSDTGRELAATDEWKTKYGLPLT